MSEEQIFAAALEKRTRAEQSAFLDTVCAADPAMRQRIEAMLKAHEKIGNFLEWPAVEQMAVVVPPPRGDTLSLEVSAQEEHKDALPVAQHNPNETQAEVGGKEDDDAVLAFLQPSQKPGSLGRLAHYEVLEVLGHGGFGTVVKAFDEKLHRIVAIKVMSPQLAATSPARKRFLREARAAAAVRHEYVVDIHAVEEQPLPYLVMEYIAGETLQQKLNRTGPLEVAEVLRLGQQIARGLATAHAKGLIHRDIKPANILLEAGVEEKVKITDFGLARAADDASVTQSGVIAGTPMYMAPEQARGEVVDQRADLFSLGSVLYVMCSGRPPFRAAAALAVLKRVVEDTPRPIQEIIPEIPEWLCAIIAKLHAKDRNERFQSAAAVAELLAQHLAHVQQPQRAPLPLPPPVAWQRPARRRRWQPVAVAAGLLLAIAGAVSAYLWLGSGEPARHDGIAKKDGPEPKPPALLTLDELAKMPSPFDGRQQKDIPRPLLALAGGGDADQAPPELVAMLGEARKFPMPDNGGRSWLVQSANGKLLAVAYGSNVALFDGQTGELLRTLTGHTGRAFALAFSLDGKLLASGAGDGDRTARVWDVQTGQTVATFTGQNGNVSALAFSPDGKQVVSGGEEPATSLRVWSAETGMELFSLDGHSGMIFSVVFSPDGKRIVSGSRDKTVRVWDVETTKEIQCLQGHTRPARKVAFSPNGKLLATGSDAELILWGAETLKPIKTLPTPAGWLAFDPDGQTLLAGIHETGGRVHKVTRWNIATGQEVASYPLQGQGSWALYHLSPDGKTLFGTRDVPDIPYVRTYDAATGTELLPQRGHNCPVRSVAVSPNGRIVASGAEDATVKLWDVGNAKAEDALWPVRTLVGKHKQNGTIHSVVFSRDGKWLASGSTDGTIALWNVPSGAQGKVLRGNSTTYSRVAFSPDSQTLAAGGADGKIRFWHVASGKQVGDHIPAHGNRPIREVAFSPDGKLLASAGEDRFVRLWELPSGELLNEYECSKNTPVFCCVAFSGDGKLLAAGSDAPESLLRVWHITDPSNWKLKAELRGHNPHCFTCAFQPGGSIVATGAHDFTVRLWDLAMAGKHVLTLRGAFGRRIDGVAFSPTGAYLATANENGTISILRVPTPPPAFTPGAPIKLPDPVELAKRSCPADALKREDIPADLLAKAGGGDPQKAPPELVAILAHYDQQVLQVAISPDGKLLASAGHDGKAKIWDLTTGNLLHTCHHQDIGIDIAFVPRDKQAGPSLLLATAGSRGSRTLKLWDATTGQELRTLSGPVVSRIASSPDGRWLASNDHRDTIHVWDPTTGRPLRTLTTALHGDLVASPDGRLLATADADGAVRLWDPLSGWLLATLDGHQGPVRAIAFLPDGRTLASSGQTDKTIRLWDLQSLRQKQVLNGTRTNAVKVAWRADGRLLASDDCEDGTVRLWNATAEPALCREIRLFRAPVRFLHGIAMTPEGRYLATANPDGTVYILKLAEPGEVLQVPPPHALLQPKAAGPAHDRFVTSVLFAGDGNTLISAGKDGFVKRWHWRAEPRPGPSIPAQEDGVRALACTADGKTLATAGFDGVIRLWNLDGQQLHELPGHKGGTVVLLFEGGGARLLSGGADGKVRFWNVKDGKPLSQLDAAKDGITHLSLSRNGKTLATSGDNQTVRLWDVDAATLTASLPDCTAACFSPDGERLAVATRSGTIELRDTTASQVRMRLRGHTGSPDGLCFSADGKQLVSYGKDGGLHLWDAARGQLLAVLRGCQGRPCCVTLAADGKAIAAGTDDGKLLVWDAFIASN